MTDAEKLEECRKLIQSWAWIGFNGSPYTEAQAIRLQSIIQNEMWKKYIEIFGKDP